MRSVSIPFPPFQKGFEHTAELDGLKSRIQVAGASVGGA